MASALPKALHQIGGRALLDHVVSTAQQLDPNDVLVVIGHECGGTFGPAPQALFGGSCKASSWAPAMRWPKHCP